VLCVMANISTDLRPILGHFDLLNVRAAQSLASSDDVDGCVQNEDEGGDLVPLRKTGRQMERRRQRKLSRLMVQTIDDPRHKDVEHQ
jgi:hypothetical protein